MKKGSKNQPKTESATLADRLKNEKATVIALVIAAILFFGALFGIYSGNILHGAGDIFSSDPDERIEFERATVVEIVSEDMTVEEMSEGAYTGSQELSVVVKSGVYKGETMTVFNYFGPLSGVPVSRGDSVVLT